MGLYDALRTILVGGSNGHPSGPLENLYRLRLPEEQTAEVDSAYIPVTGLGPTRVLGSRPIQGVSWRGPGNTDPHDGGVAWFHAGVQFQIRAQGNEASEVEAAEVAAAAIRDILSQYAGAPVEIEGERIHRCETNSPGFYEQDERGRPIMALTAEIWHKPAREV